ncbi:hypothetical protein CANINC_001133 [Pichia inconspicua]|uniref:Spc7 kinetochore protein domain-containing protein n=1 Tax=Pichia inconspicua TaxID=52247 RepID=A0A4T0X4R9_9ASCO|nr:hypothetical protein CANINC_001133 [[Candida] inconspicua]
MDNLHLSKSSKRLSLPVITKDITSLSFNRRHTLVPGRGILKAAADDNNTINVLTDIMMKEKRRVSFAPEVTLHKINYARANEGRKLKRRSSLTGNPASQETEDAGSKLTTSRYLGKVYELPPKNDANGQHSTDDKQSSNESLQDKSDQFIVDEETQTMEMSLELTNQIKKQQDVIREQIIHEENTQITPNTHSSLRDLFEEVDQELDADTSNSQHMNVTPDPEVDSEELDMTETFHFRPNNEIEPQENQFYNPENDIGNRVNESNVIGDDDQTMEFTQPISKDLASVVQSENNSVNSSMDLTDPAPKSDIGMNDTDYEETMELTIAVNEKSNTEMETPEMLMRESEEDLSRSNGIAQECEFRTTEVPMSSNIVIQNPHRILTQTDQVPNKRDSDFADEINASLISYRDTSEMETSLIETEMVPLAEVTVDMTENGDTYESDHSFSDDNYINISLDVFLHDVNVQFFDKIGPSKNEVDQTLALNSDFRSSVSLSPSSMSSSVTSTPLSISASNTDSKSTIADLIDACVNIPYYHYLVHLITQYKSSIQSISTMVNTFCNDLLESNPTAIREFYQQSEDVKLDLCTNYQALATVTRKQTKLQNMKFVSGLLEQLSLSYERVNQTMEDELSKTLEWRKSVLIERQKMIEKKVELDQELQKLNVLKDSFASIDMDKFLKNKVEIDAYEEKKNRTKKKIAEIDELTNEKIVSLDNKKMKRKQLMEDINFLKEEVEKKTVPTASDLESLSKRLAELELEKDVKLIDVYSNAYLFSERLQVQFKPYSGDLDLVMLSYKDSSEFAPFNAIADLFVTSNQKTIKRGEKFQELKKLVHSWRQFILLWKDLLMIHYVYSCTINDDQFEISFDISSTNDEFSQFKVRGNTQHLFLQDKIPVTLERSWTPNAHELQEDDFLNLINIKLNGRNRLVKRFTINL